MRVLAVAIALALASGIWAKTAQAAVRVGDPAPALVGQTVDGQAFDLSTLRGHVVIVNLWATWCPPCRAEMPMLDAFYSAHKADGLFLVGLSADRLRDLGDVRRVIKAFGYPSLIAANAKANGFGAPTTLPVTFVIGPDGAIKAILVPANAPLTAGQLTNAVAWAATAK